LADDIICYLTKPCDEDALFGCVSSALERAKPEMNIPASNKDNVRKADTQGAGSLI
jgi:hypothetical protein